VVGVGGVWVGGGGGGALRPTLAARAES